MVTAAYLVLFNDSTLLTALGPFKIVRFNAVAERVLTFVQSILENVMKPQKLP